MLDRDGDLFYYELVLHLRLAIKGEYFGQKRTPGVGKNGFNFAIFVDVVGINFRGIYFRESTIFIDFARIYFRESTVFIDFARIYFRELGVIRENLSSVIIKIIVLLIKSFL